MEDLTDSSHTANEPDFLWTIPVLPLLERSCSDCGERKNGLNRGSYDLGSTEPGKSFRRVLSETWNYPSWLFVEQASASAKGAVSSVKSENGETVALVMEGADECDDEEDDEDSEDEGWYSLSRTDIRKLQEARSSSGSINIILTNPEILHNLDTQTSIYISQGDDDIKQSSQDRASYSSLSSGDSGQLSDSSKSVDNAACPMDINRKVSDSGQSSSDNSTDISRRGSPEQCHSSDSGACDCDDGSCEGAHKITVYVKYKGPRPRETVGGTALINLVEGSVDSEGEECQQTLPTYLNPCQDPGLVQDVRCESSDQITICDTRVRLRLCHSSSELNNELIGNEDDDKSKLPGEVQLVPVKRKDLFRLLGLNDSPPGLLDPSEVEGAKKVALQNFLSVGKSSINFQTGDADLDLTNQNLNNNTDKAQIVSNSDNVSKPKESKRKNLAKFLGIDLSAILDQDREQHNLTSDLEQSCLLQAHLALDCESVSLTNSSGSGGLGGFSSGDGRQSRLPGILGRALPNIRSQNTRPVGSSQERKGQDHNEEIPEQLRTPKIPQVNRKDLQRFLGVNDCEEMVYIRNVRKPQRNESHQSQTQLPATNNLHQGGNSLNPPAIGTRRQGTQVLHNKGSQGSGPNICGGETVCPGGTISSICSCVVCTNEYSPEDNVVGEEVNEDNVITNERVEPQRCEGNCKDRTTCILCSAGLVEQKCDNDKCIMCSATYSRGASGEKEHRQTTTTNLTSTNGDNNSHPPPLPRKTVAPYQEYKFGLEAPMPVVANNDKLGKEKRRKKNATKRMEQIIKIHTDTNGNKIKTSMEQQSVVQTLDRSPFQKDDNKRSKDVETYRGWSEKGPVLDMKNISKQAGEGRSRGHTRFHKRSILKQQRSSSGPEEGRVTTVESVAYMDRVASETRGTNRLQKVKFASSLHKKKEQGKYQIQSKRMNKMGNFRNCQVHFPFHPEYVDVRHLLAVVDPRYLRK